MIRFAFIVIVAFGVNLSVLQRAAKAQGPTLASINANHSNSANGGSGRPQLSANGRYLLFFSNARDLVPLSDTNGESDLFIRDLLTQTTTLVSVNRNGTGTGNRGILYSAF